MIIYFKQLPTDSVAEGYHYFFFYCLVISTEIECKWIIKVSAVFPEEKHK